MPLGELRLSLEYGLRYARGLGMTLTSHKARNWIQGLELNPEHAFAGDSGSGAVR